MDIQINGTALAASILKYNERQNRVFRDTPTHLITPGTLVACHSADIEGRVIRWGEWLRFRDGSFFNHFAVIDDHPSDNPNDPYVIQAEAHGVTGWDKNGKNFHARKLSEVSPGGSYELVLLPLGVDGSKVVTFARAQVGDAYGFLSIASIATHILLPRWLPLPTIRNNRTWICSALAAEALRFGGWLADWDDIYSVVPSELYATLHGMTVRELATLNRDR